MKFKNAYLIFFYLLIILSGCNKKDHSQPQPSVPSCFMTSTLSGNYLTTFQYSNGRLISLITYDQSNNNKVYDSMVYSYSGNLVTITDYDQNNVSSIDKILLGSNNYALSETKITYYDTYTEYDTTFYEQNSEGYLIKSSEITSTVYANLSNSIVRDTTVKIYVLTDGNVTSDTTYYNGQKTFINYVYYTDKPNLSNLSHRGSPNIFLYSFYGKPNKNLFKEYNYGPYGNGQNPELYSYEFDSNGYVTKTNISDTSGVSNQSYTYSCP